MDALAKTCARVPRKPLRKSCKAARLGTNPNFKTSADEILAEAKCKGSNCQQSLFGRLWSKVGQAAESKGKEKVDEVE